MNEVKYNDLNAVEGIEITTLNQAEPAEEEGGGGGDDEYYTLTIVVTICA